MVSVPRTAVAEAEGFIGPTIGRSGYRTMAEFDAAVGTKYQQLVDQGYADTMNRVGQRVGEERSDGDRQRGGFVCTNGDAGLAMQVEGIQEGPGRIIQINRRLYNPAGAGYRIPDVYIPGAGRSTTRRSRRSPSSFRRRSTSARSPAAAT